MVSRAWAGNLVAAARHAGPPTERIGAASSRGRRPRADTSLDSVCAACSAALASSSVRAKKWLSNWSPDTTLEPGLLWAARRAGGGGVASPSTLDGLRDAATRVRGLAVGA